MTSMCRITRENWMEPVFATIADTALQDCLPGDQTQQHPPNKRCREEEHICDGEGEFKNPCKLLSRKHCQQQLDDLSKPVVLHAFFNCIQEDFMCANC